MKATSKPIGISFCSADHVEPIIDMFDMALGSTGAFRQRPFCMAIIVHVVPPLTFAAEGVDILEGREPAADRADRHGQSLDQRCCRVGETSPEAIHPRGVRAADDDRA